MSEYLFEPTKRIAEEFLDVGCMSYTGFYEEEKCELLFVPLPIEHGPRIDMVFFIKNNGYVLMETLLINNVPEEKWERLATLFDSNLQEKFKLLYFKLDSTNGNLLIRCDFKTLIPDDILGEMSVEVWRYTKEALDKIWPYVEIALHTDNDIEKIVSDLKNELV